MPPFIPLLRNPHAQTILGHYWPRPDSHSRFPATRRLFRTDPETQVLVVSQQPAGAARGDVVMVHGLESSGAASYIESFACATLAAGFATHRFHLRTCGGTEHLSNTFYHAGQTADLLSVLRQLRAEGHPPVFLAGFSLGGNVILKLAGELAATAPECLRGLCAVSTPIDLYACACRLSQPENRIYESRFVRRMRSRLCATGRYRESEFAGVTRLFEVDDRFTAPAFGFGTAENYYRSQSALHWVAAIRVPTVLLQSRDDSLVPFDVFESAAVRGNPHIEVMATDHGGHLGFIARHRPRLWLDGALVEWIAAHAA